MSGKYTIVNEAKPKRLSPAERREKLRKVLEEMTEEERSTLRQVLLQDIVEDIVENSAARVTEGAARLYLKTQRLLKRG